MKILAVETATEACSAALLIDDQVMLRYQVQPRMHSQLILPMLDALLAEAGLVLSALDAIAFGRGPGAFTGVRIAVGVAQGAAFAADLPLVPVSTLAALAQRALRESGQRRILPAYDARMQEVYWGAYEATGSGLVRMVVEDEVSQPGEVTAPPGDGWHGAGTGWGSHREALQQRLPGQVQSVDGTLLCSAHDVALLGAAGFSAGLAEAAETAAPLYLRDKVASRPGN